MQTIRLTKEFDFEMAHVLMNYDGPCKNIHGHSYKLFITVIGEPKNDETHPKHGMLIDFGDLKRIVKDTIINKFDHCLVVNKNAPTQFTDIVKKMFEKFELLNYQPTCENLVVDFAERLKNKLPVNVKLHSIKLSETATSYAEWFASDNEE